MLYDLKVGERFPAVVTLLNLSEVHYHSTGGKSIDPYRIMTIRLEGQDIRGIAWESIVQSSGMEPGDTIDIDGEMTQYNNMAQIKILEAHVLPTSGIDGRISADEPPDYEPMLNEIHTLLKESVTDGDYMALVEDELAELRKRIAQAGCNEYVGISNALSNTASLLRLTDRTALEYGDGICRSLLAAGTLFSGLSPVFKPRKSGIFTSYYYSSERAYAFGKSRSISKKKLEPLKHMILKCNDEPHGNDNMFPESELLRIEIEEMRSFREMRNRINSIEVGKTSGSIRALGHRKVYNHGNLEED